MAAERSRRAKVVTRPRWVRRTKRVAVFLVTALLVCVGALGALYAPIYREAVDNVQTIDSKLVVTDANPSVITSADGVVLYRISLLRRTVVDVDTLPSYVRYAMVAAEDRRFFDHRGVDVVGLLRSAFLAVRDRHASQGGSTIDMQLAKKLVNGDEHSMSRKLKDIATAQQIERLKTKNQILNLYMNEVYFGEGSYGIEAAAETYFAKHAKDLTVAEAAMLARCVRSPSRDNPIRDLQGSIARRDYVLAVMQEERWITDEQYRLAVHETPKLNPDPPEGVRQMNSTAGYFVEHVLQQFRQDFPGVDLQTGGYRIVTTLNFKLQQAAVQAVKKTIRDHRKHDRVTDAAFVLIDSQGQILAEVGGPDYTKNKWNTITQGHRQPGSAFKPFVYAAALKDGLLHPWDDVSNEPIHEVNDGVAWDPGNNGHEPVGGFVKLTKAFKDSYNLPAIHTIQAVGPHTVVKYAHEAFGFRSDLPEVESLGIGTCNVTPLEMTEGYSVFMLKGDRVRPYPIARVIGPDGSVLKEYQPQRFTGVFDPVVCQEIEDLLQLVVQHGTGYEGAHDVPDAKGKTGTTQRARDAWFCGYSDGVLGVGWVGNTVWKNGKPSEGAMRDNVYGGTVTAYMWADVMKAAHALKLTTPPPPTPSPGDQEAAVVAKAEHPKPATTTPDPSDTISPDGQPLQPDPDTPQAPATGPGNGDQTPVQQARKALPSPAPPPPKATQASVKTDDESDYVEVQVCADTGMRASIYCPETVTKRFKRGTEPKQVCRLHSGG